MRPAAAASLRPWVCAAVEAAILSALLAATATRLADPRVPATLLLPKALVGALVLQLCLYYNDLYEDFAWRRRVELFVRVGQSFGAGFVVLTLIFYTFPPLDVGGRVLAVYLPVAFCVIVAWRFIFLWAAGHEALRERVLILGTGQSARQVAREVLRRAPLGFTVVGFLGETRAEVGRHVVNPSVIGTTADLLPLVEAYSVELIVVALDDRRAKMPMAELLQCRMAGIRVEDATGFYERIAGNIMLHNLRPSWLIFARGFNRPRIVRNAKRAVDFVGALVLLVLLAPLFAIIALLIKLTGPGPVFYRQERVGEKGRIFSVIKFRSMRTGAEADTGPVWSREDHDPRVTWIGRHLRQFRLDELPQLLNVVPGEMSFVGPRPERPYFVERLRKVIPYYDERHNVKPGITGWAQIKFGYSSTIEDAERKLEFDLYYVKNMSLFLDIAIILDTIKVVLPGRGERYYPGGR